MDNKYNQITIRAYAKINLSLHITGQKANGYHLLDSVFVPVSIYDEVIITEAHSGIRVICDKGIPSDKTNTAYKAAEAMRKYADFKDVDIEIKKNIPSMAGLGGGSSDAAAVLIGLNKLFGLSLPKEKLMELGVQIGADVPFFIGGSASRVQGIGEILTPVEICDTYNLVIIKPKQSLSTPGVYSAYDMEANRKNGSSSNLIKAVRAGDVKQIASNLWNDLQPAAEKMCPDVSKSISFLKKQGAINAVMTGSGSCVFGIFIDNETAQQAINNYKNDGNIYFARTHENTIEIV